MSEATVIGLIVFAVMIALVLLGIPIYISVIGCSVVGLYLVGGPQILVTQLSSGILSLSASYTYAVIPLFVLVGSLAELTHIAEGTFSAAKTWLGRLNGGLLYTVIIANAIFGACSGVSTAGTVVFSKIAAPELKKHGYDEKLTLGCITASSSLSVLIPPSIGILTLCLLADISIGTGLLCGFAAGLMMTVVLMIIVKVISVAKKGSVPPVTEEDRRVSWRDRGKALKLLVPIVAIFFLVVGGSYFGWFPATVGGGIASTAILCYAIVLRTPVKKIFECLRDSAQVFCGIFLIIIGGSLFSRFVSITGLARGLITLIGKSGLPPYGVFLLVMAFYLLCGCVMNCMTIIIITIPVVFPLLTGVGFNGYVVCIILVFLAELGGITPPFGLNVFTVSNVLRIPPSKVFTGSIPFLICYIVCILLAAAFPNVLLWLPRLLGASV